MSDKIIENNQVTVIGEVISEFVYSYEVFGEGFYMVDILVKRLSNLRKQTGMPGRIESVGFC